jgi:hypothetical protein
MARQYNDYHEVKSHPYWEDMIGFALGALIVAAPYLVSEAVSPAVQAATGFLGCIIAFAAVAERMQIIVGEKETAREWEELVQALASATLIALPFIAGYASSGALRYWDFALGGLVFLLAIIELRRDYVSDLDRLGLPHK